MFYIINFNKHNISYFSCILHLSPSMLSNKTNMQPSKPYIYYLMPLIVLSAILPAIVNMYPLEIKLSISNSIYSSN